MTRGAYKFFEINAIMFFFFFFINNASVPGETSRGSANKRQPL